MSGRTIIVGDIHGCYDELAALLDKVGAGADDSVIATGDLIVKGEGNRRVLDLFMSDARFSAVLGNHDRAILRYWRGETAKLKSKQELCRRELEEAGASVMPLISLRCPR
jgi:predicted phosphodiesterase